MKCTIYLPYIDNRSNALTCPHGVDNPSESIYKVNMQTESIREVLDFVGKAERLGKYRPNTAAGLRAALRAMASSITTEDPDSLEHLRRNAEDILHRQVQRAGMAAHTFQTYAQRLQRVLGDFVAYGQDARQLVNWKPRHRDRRPTQDSGRQGGRVRTLAWSLRPDLVIEIELPLDFNAKDRTRLNQLLDLELKLRAE